MMMIPRRNGNGLDFWDEVLPDSFFTEKESKLMKTDLKEKDGKYFLEIDIPGYEKEDIKIELHDGYLTVSAEKNEEKFVQMLNAVEWSDTALRRMLPAMEESELQIAKAYILEKIRTKETFEV